MTPNAEPDDRGIERVISNEDLWYLRLGAWLGVYRRDLTHTTVRNGVLAVPRDEVGYWRERLAELKAGTLEHGRARALFVHESVHVRQMSGHCFWLWGLHYILSRRFRRRIEEEAYTVHLTYLARCGIPVEAPYWMEHFRRLYFGAFNEARARESFDRIAAAVRESVPQARIVYQAAESNGPPPRAPRQAERAD